MALPAIRFGRNVPTDTWSNVLAALHGTTVRVSCNDGTKYEGEIADAHKGVLHVNHTATATVAIPVEMITAVVLP